MDSDKKLYRGPKRTVVVTILLSALFSMAAANLPSAWGQTKSEMDLETLLANVRKALTPAGNMRIKWTTEGFHPGVGKGFYPRKGPRKRPDGVIEEYNYRKQYNCLITEAGSRLEKKYEHAGPDGRSMFIFRETFVYDGTEMRSLRRRVKGSPYPDQGHIHFTNSKTPFRFRDAFCNFWVWSGVWSETGGLKEYKRLKVRQNRGIFVIEATGDRGGWSRLITIDGNRGYHIIKEESFRGDGSKSRVHNCKLKKYPNGTWFIKERETIRFLTRSDPGRVEEKTRVISIQFDVPTPAEDTFKLRFPEGTWVTDPSFNYSEVGDFVLGCLGEAKHTQEDPAVTAILDQYAGKEKTVGLNEILGPARELCVNSIYERKDCFIDFDTGRLMSIPADYSYSIFPSKWFEQNGIDGRVEIEEGLTGLWTFNTVVVPVRNDRWETITPAVCHELLDKIDRVLQPQSGRSGTHPVYKNGIYPPIMSAEGQLPATFLFQTTDGRGIVQIIEVQNDTVPKCLKIRYKMLGPASRLKKTLRVRQTVSIFVFLVIQGKRWRTSTGVWAHPELDTVKQINYFKQIPDLEKLSIADVYADSNDAIVLSSAIRDDHKKKQSVFHLVYEKGTFVNRWWYIKDIRLPANEKGIWLIKEIELLAEESAGKRLSEFLKKHPDAE